MTLLPLYMLVLCVLASPLAVVTVLILYSKRKPKLSAAMRKTVLVVAAVWFLYPFFQLIWPAAFDCSFCSGSGYRFTREVFLSTLSLGTRSLIPGIISGCALAFWLVLPLAWLASRLRKQPTGVSVSAETVRPGRRRFPWLAVPAAAALGLAAWVSVLSVDVYSYSLTSDPARADAAIVLGAAVWNGQPSPVYTERLRHAVDLYQRGQVGALIFTGGVGAYDQVAELAAGRAYARERGVPEEAIYTEAVSRDTVDNLLQAEAIVRREDFGRVLIVSDPLHMKRAVSLARDMGLDAYSSPTPTSRYTSFNTKLEFLLREVYFLGVYRLTDER